MLYDLTISAVLFDGCVESFLILNQQRIDSKGAKCVEIANSGFAVRYDSCYAVFLFCRSKDG